MKLRPSRALVERPDRDSTARYPLGAAFEPEPDRAGARALSFSARSRENWTSRCSTPEPSAMFLKVCHPHRAFDSEAVRTADRVLCSTLVQRVLHGLARTLRHRYAPYSSLKYVHVDVADDIRAVHRGRRSDSPRGSAHPSAGLTIPRTYRCSVLYWPVDTPPVVSRQIREIHRRRVRVANVSQHTAGDIVQLAVPARSSGSNCASCVRRQTHVLL